MPNNVEFYSYEDREQAIAKAADYLGHATAMALRYQLSNNVERALPWMAEEEAWQTRVDNLIAGAPFGRDKLRTQADDASTAAAGAILRGYS